MPAVSNSSVILHDAALPSDETVSGWSIFWALVAIITHAMLQHSFTGHIWNFDGRVHPSFWPQRSSPFICVIDGIADAYLISRALRALPEPPDEEEDGPRPGREGALTRLVLFVLGVLPQAIKLFSMRGIPQTQVVVAMYLLPSILGLLRSFVSERDPARDMDHLVRSMREVDEISDVLLKALVSLCGWWPHIIGAYAVVYGFVDRVGFSASVTINDVVLLLHLLLNTAAILNIVQSLAFMLADKKSPIPPWPILVILSHTNMCSIPLLLGAPGQELKKGFAPRAWATATFLLNLDFACYLCSSLVSHLADWVYRQYGARCERCRWSPVFCSCSGRQDLAPSSSMAFGGEHHPSPLDYLPTASGTEEQSHHQSSSTQTRTTLSSTHSVSEFGTPSDSPPSKPPVPAAVEQVLASLDNAMGITDNGYLNGLGPFAGPSSSKRPSPDHGEQIDAVEATSSPLWRLKVWDQLHHALFMVVRHTVTFSWKLSKRSHEPSSKQPKSMTNPRGAAEQGCARTPAGSHHHEDDQQAQRSSTAETAPPEKVLFNGLRRPGTSWLRVMPMVLYEGFTWTKRILEPVALGIVFPQLHAIWWIWWQVTERYPIRIFFNAFGLWNFSLVILYYLVFFDATGTSAPAWSEALG